MYMNKYLESNKFLNNITKGYCSIVFKREYFFGTPCQTRDLKGKDLLVPESNYAKIERPSEKTC